MTGKLKLFFASVLLFVSFFTSAQNIPARPNPPRLVNDFAGVLSPTEVQQLEQQLIAYDDSTSNQVAIVLVKTLNDYPIEEYATKLFRAWGVGNKKTNNGIVILAAIDDRKIRIEVGYGLEGAIPDITANHIIQNDIVPNFRSGDYFDGLSKASNSIIKAAAGEYTAPADYRKKKGGGSLLPFGFLVFVIIMVVIFGGNNRGGGGGFMSRRGSGWLGPFILGSMIGRGSGGSSWGGGGGGWSGGGGGGGFGGFGGGSSGGGGASGSW